MDIFYHQGNVIKEIYDYNSRSMPDLNLQGFQQHGFIDTVEDFVSFKKTPNVSVSGFVVLRWACA